MIFQDVHDKTILELKKMCKEILEKEAKKDEIILDVFPVTILEYYQSDIYKRKVLLKRMADRLLLMKTLGIYQPETKEMIIFIDKIADEYVMTFGMDIILTAFISYHEYKHQLQTNKPKLFSYETFVVDMELCLLKYLAADYRQHHDEYFIEADANLYGIKKAKEYLEDKFPIISDIGRKHLDEQYGKEAKYYLKTYDFLGFFHKFYQLFISGIPIRDTQRPVLDIFFDENRYFKNLSEILSDQRLSLLDRRITYGILGSSSFLEQLNFATLNEKEREFMRQVIQYIIQEEREKLRYNQRFYQEKKEQLQEFLSSNKTIIDKIKYLTSLNNMLAKQINSFSSRCFVEELQTIYLEEIQTPKKRVLK